MLPRTLAELPDEPLRDGSVKLGSKTPEQTPVHDLLRQEVLEHELPIALDGRGLLAANQGARFQSRKLLIDGPVGERVGDGPFPEAATDDRGILENPFHFSIQSVDAGTEKALDGVRNLNELVVAGRDQHAVLLAQGAILEQGPAEFLQKEGIASRSSGDAIEQPIRHVVGLEQSVEQAP
jgi:hypothetical protein